MADTLIRQQKIPATNMAAVIKRGRKAFVPKDKKSFGHTVWQILGEEDANMGEAAARLGTSPANLSNIIHGQYVTPKFLKERRWREVFEAHYASNWERHWTAFEVRAARLAKPSRKSNGHDVKSPHREAREPEDKNSAGYAVWLIVGGKDAHIGEAAVRLKMSSGDFSHFIHGRKISQQAILDKKWRETFAAHYPEGWEQHRGLFEQRVSSLPARASGQPREPDNKNGFGHVLWQILGGKDAYLTEAAERLQITDSKLSAILHKRGNITQQKLLDKDWRKVLATHYAEGWARHRQTFEERVLKLPRFRTGQKTSEPKNKNSFGHVLWEILGGEDTALGEAAGRLQVLPGYLSTVIHNKQRPSQQALVENKWREIFAEHYPEGWKKHKGTFEKYARLLVSGPNRPYEPEDEDSFGYVVQQILGGTDVNMTEAAERLELKPNELAAVIYDHRRFSQQSVVEKKWRETLAAHYADGWQRHRQAFEACFRMLPKDIRHRTREPENKNSFGYVLWQIIGGKKANIGKSAKLLKISHSRLSNIIHDSKPTVQETVLGGEWPKILALHYPEGWKQHHAAFEEYLAQLPAEGPGKTYEPADKSSFGYALWKIIGGMDCNVAATAALLGIPCGRLSSIIHSRTRIAYETVVRKKWAKTLAANYPEGWRQHGAAFDRLALIQPGAYNTRKITAAPKEKKDGDMPKAGNNAATLKEWRRAAGEFVRRARAERGDEIEDILPGVAAQVLKKKATWERIEAGDPDPKLATSLFRSAIAEICNLYNLKEVRTGDEYGKARQLLEARP